MHAQNWRGNVFIVDDNFIGNKRKLKKETLPALINWSEKMKYPFTFFTEASLNLADDKELMDLIVRAGFDTVFVGIETPNEASLDECNKVQNKNRDLGTNIKRIQRAGLQVQGGFILGFDNDSSSIFEELIKFIQDSGITTAMVGILTALKGTNQYQRMVNEKRLLKSSTGNNTDLAINFITKMNRETLIEGYKKVIKTIYSPKNYYSRIKSFLKEYKPMRHRTKVSINDLIPFFRSIIYVGIIGKERMYYWKLLVWSLIRKPHFLSLAITLSVYGFHFRKSFNNALSR